MTLDLTNPDLDFALKTVRLAAQLAKQVQAELVEPALTKDDWSPVTVADFAAQAVVGCLLDRAYPNDPLVAEEDSAALPKSEIRSDQGKTGRSHSEMGPASSTRDTVVHFVGRVLAYATDETVCSWIDRGTGACSSRFWTLDPIDGTKGFLRGDQYAVALALLVDGRVQLGVLGCPNLSNGHRPEVGGPGSIIAAVRGQGAWATPLDGAEFTPLHVSAIANPTQARLLRSFEAGHTNVGRMGALVETLGVKAEPVRMDSQAKYGVLAAGAGDLLIRLLSSKQPDYREKIWDQAAGSIVVEEAGGRITDLLGRPLDFTQGRILAGNRGVCASNGLLHEAALAALHRIGAVPS